MRAKKKLLSLLLGGLIAGLLPTTALAAGTKDTGKGIQTGTACIPTITAAVVTMTTFITVPGIKVQSNGVSFPSREMVVLM